MRFVPKLLCPSWLDKVKDYFLENYRAFRIKNHSESQHGRKLEIEDFFLLINFDEVPPGLSETNAASVEHSQKLGDCPSPFSLTNPQLKNPRRRPT